MYSFKLFIFSIRFFLPSVCAGVCVCACVRACVCVCVCVCVCLMTYSCAFVSLGHRVTLPLCCETTRNTTVLWPVPATAPLSLAHHWHGRKTGWVLFGQLAPPVFPNDRLPADKLQRCRHSSKSVCVSQLILILTDHARRSTVSVFEHHTEMTTLYKTVWATKPIPCFCCKPEHGVKAHKWVTVIGI